MNIDDCNAVIEDSDPFKTLIAYLKHIETKHPRTIREWIDTKQFHQIITDIEIWLER